MKSVFCFSTADSSELMALVHTQNQKELGCTLTASAVRIHQPSDTATHSALHDTSLCLSASRYNQARAHAPSAPSNTIYLSSQHGALLVRPPACVHHESRA